jgi:hypothetical protein
MTRNLHSGGYLSAVVTDSRAAMPRLPGVAESDPGGPRELAAVPSRQGGRPKAELVAASDIAPRQQLGRSEHSHDRAAESEHEGAGEGVAPSTVPRDGATVREASLDLAVPVAGELVNVPVAEEGTVSGDAAEPRGAFEVGSTAGNAREAGAELAVTTDSDFDNVQTAERVATGRRAGPHEARQAESRPPSSAAGERNASDDVLAATAPSRDATQHRAALSDRERGAIPESDAAVPLSRSSAHARSRQPDSVQTAQAHAVGKNPSRRWDSDPQETPAAYRAVARTHPSNAVESTRTSEPAVLRERNDDASITDRAAEPELRRAAEVRQTAAGNITDASYNLPVVSRSRSLEQRPSRVQPASARPEAEGIHIGTLDIRIEAPKQRLQPPSRQPVSFRGSGIASRLYLRRD